MNTTSKQYYKVPVQPNSISQVSQDILKREVHFKDLQGLKCLKDQASAGRLKGLQDAFPQVHLQEVPAAVQRGQQVRLRHHRGAPG